MKWLNRIVQYYKNKKLAKKCMHESETERFAKLKKLKERSFMCEKCGEFYR